MMDKNGQQQMDQATMDSKKWTNTIPGTGTRTGTGTKGYEH
jgi:hypothetical protein